MIVWVLVITLWGRSTGTVAPLVIDNIASSQDCVALGNVIKARFPDNVGSSRCYSVRKIK
jgi:hypothetical protein